MRITYGYTGGGIRRPLRRACHNRYGIQHICIRRHKLPNELARYLICEVVNHGKAVISLKKTRKDTTFLRKCQIGDEKLDYFRQKMHKLLLSTKKEKNNKNTFEGFRSGAPCTNCY